MGRFAAGLGTAVGAIGAWFCAKLVRTEVLTVPELRRSRCVHINWSGYESNGDWALHGCFYAGFSSFTGAQLRSGMVDV